MTQIAFCKRKKVHLGSGAGYKDTVCEQASLGNKALKQTLRLFRFFASQWRSECCLTPHQCDHAACLLHASNKSFVNNVKCDTSTRLKKRTKNEGKNTAVYVQLTAINIDRQ